MKPKILVFCDYFWPGYRAGGPITTLRSTIKQLESHFDFSVVSRDRDYQSRQSYETVNSNNWNETPYGRVFYNGSRFIRLKRLKEFISSENPHYIYLNSLFSLSYSFLILVFVKLVLRSSVNVVLCPRGELNDSALKYGRYKKSLFLFVFRVFQLHRKVLWQATNDKEYGQIQAWFGSDVGLNFAPNLTWGVKEGVVFNQLEKKRGCLKLIFVARINDLKNLKHLLRILGKNTWGVELGIVGPIDEADYWNECERMIDALGENVVVSYLGEMNNAEILERILDFHFLCLPTRGENFGQAIYESLSVGRPVIISDQTPWTNLVAKRAGWEVDITSLASMEGAISTAIGLNDLEWKELCEGALGLATAYNKSSLDYNLRLFEQG